MAYIFKDHAVCCVDSITGGEIRRKETRKMVTTAAEVGRNGVLWICSEGEDIIGRGFK